MITAWLLLTTINIPNDKKKNLCPYIYEYFWIFLIENIVLWILETFSVSLENKILYHMQLNLHSKSYLDSAQLKGSN